MFVLLAKIVGCCGISCKKLPHVVPNLQQCLPATLLWQCPRKGWRFANNQRLSQELYHTTGQISRCFAKFPHHLHNFFHRERPTPSPTLKNPTPAKQNATQTKRGTLLTKQNTTLAPTATQNIPQSPTPRPTALPHVCENGVANHLVAQLCGNARRKFWLYARQNSQHGCGI